jgi:hypothetical protein
MNAQQDRDPMPGSAMWEIASAARVIRRITAKQPTKPAATPAPMDSAMALRSNVIVNVIGDFAWAPSPAELYGLVTWRRQMS